MTSKMTRRGVLRGACGAALALPALEIMRSGRARADDSSIPKRYVVCFAGSSLGRKWTDGDPATTDLFVPDTIGADYDLKTALVPLGTYDVRSDVSVISNLLLPWASSNIPAGGRFVNFHNFCYGPLLTGMRNAPEQVVRGTSSEHIVGAAIGGDTRVREMVYRVQAASYGNNAHQSTMSFVGDPGGGLSQPVAPKVSPLLVWEELFDGVVLDADADQSEAIDRMRRRRVSVLDLVAESTRDLTLRVGSRDRIRLEQHFDAVRDLERRIDGLGGMAGGEGCILPQVPGADPPVGTDYGGEDERAAALCDLIHLAFACDLSRAGSLMFTTAQSGLNMQPITGEQNNLHDIGHTPDSGIPGERVEAMARAIEWHVEHFARLVRKLADTPEIDGSRLLDHCALTLVLEGGRGYDPQTDRDNSVHSTENMAALIAGGAGGMQQGRHIRTNQVHPAAVINTAMHAVGVTDGLNEVSTVIDELF